MKHVGLIGHPLGHSISPAFQEAAFRACSFEVTYEPWDTPPGSLESRVASLRDPSCLGANVTIPYKEPVIPLLDETGDRSLESGAVNTIVNRDGRLFGFNTDGQGFVNALREANFEPAGKRFLLLGAGGASRGIAFALCREGAATIAVANRTPERAAELVADLRAAGCRAEHAPWADGIAGYGCIVNCTSLGMAGGPPGAPPADFTTANPDSLIVDIVYNPPLTPFLEAAEHAGLRTLPGLPMLVHQGAIGFELWTGAPAPLAVMYAAARKALQQLAPGRPTDS